MLELNTCTNCGGVYGDDIFVSMTIKRVGGQPCDCTKCSDCIEPVPDALNLTSEQKEFFGDVVTALCLECLAKRYAFVMGRSGGKFETSLRKVFEGG